MEITMMLSQFTSENKNIVCMPAYINTYVIKLLKSKLRIEMEKRNT